METGSTLEVSAEVDENEQALETINTSLGFLLIIIAGLILSFVATVRQRDAICCAMAGETEKAAALSDVFPIRCRASALTIGGAGFFLCLAIQGVKNQAATATAAARCSAYRNLWVAILVLVADMTRLTELIETERSGGETLAEEVQPD